MAHKLNTEFKIDITRVFGNKLHPYGLDKLNISAPVATPEEIKICKAFSEANGLGTEPPDQRFVPEVLDYPDNVYLRGYWIKEQYFADIADIIRKEFTLKDPLSPCAEAWKKKILSAECSVAMHFRHGDFIYNPNRQKSWHGSLSLDFYCDTINFLKKEIYNNPTAFVFSNNLHGCKKNLHLDVPTEFVEGCANHMEELYLMSLCHHDIIPPSTFSWWAAWLNPNPDKKVFQANPASATRAKSYRYSLDNIRKKDSELDSDKWIYVPYDNQNPQDIEMRPYFSICLVVNNDASTIQDTLDSLFELDYKYYEVIIIDNASTDGTDEICRKAIAGKKNVTFKSLWSKMKNTAVWNMAFKFVQGYFVSFLKGNDRLLPDTLSILYAPNEYALRDISCSFAWLEENQNGEITFGDKTFIEKRDKQFQKNTDRFGLRGKDAFKYFNNQQLNTLMGTKLFKCEFLKEYGIKFDERLPDDMAEMFFLIEAFFKAKDSVFVPNAFYISPRKSFAMNEKLNEPLLSVKDKPASTAKDKPDPTAEDKPDPTAEDKPAPTAEDKPDPTAEDKPAPTAEDKPASTAEDKPDPTTEDKPDPTAEEVPANECHDFYTAANLDALDISNINRARL